MSPVRSLFRFSPSVCLALLVASLLSASPAQAVITHVQQASNSDASSATYTPFSATFPSATASNAIILGVTYGNTDPTITVTDNYGNGYARAIKTYDAGHNQGCAIFYSINVRGGASHTVTVNFSAPVAYLALGIHEYSGVASLDVTSGSIGNGTSISSGSATTTAGGDLLFGCTAEDQVGHGDTFTAGAGFTKRVDLGNAAAYADEDAIQSTAGPAAATFTLSPNLGWIADLAAFRASTAGGGGGPSITNVSPTSGPVGTSVTITGQHFGAIQNSSGVTFNGTPAAITTWSDTQIVAVV